MIEVNASIITIGDELLIGQTIDSNSAFIGMELNKIGIWVKRRVAIGDIKEDILDTLAEQAQLAQVIFITGGLGPTADDITKPALCAYFRASLVQNKEVEQHVRGIFSRANRPMSDRNIKQAEVPDNCTVLHNARGTAPGMWFEKDGIVYISLPGVPAEMMGLVEKEVIPRLKSHFDLPLILHQTALTFGCAESALADVLLPFENSLPPYIKLAYLPNYRMVKLRLTAKGSDREQLKAAMEKHFAAMKEYVAQWLVAEEDITIVEIVSRLLQERHQWVATAESCTGGYIAHLLSSRPGSSRSFKGGVVSYANEVKENTLSVQRATLEEHGAVSEQTVKEMANAVLQLMHVDYGIATSGIMGPDGGTTEKPVGTVWIAIAGKGSVVAQKHFVHMDRKRNIEITASIALNMLRRFIVKESE
ncbi:MAG: CinA family nicotinamide mononucleotide deamidase-related protein [Chitinophagaceae bacterium]